MTFSMSMTMVFFTKVLVCFTEFQSEDLEAQKLLCLYGISNDYSFQQASGLPQALPKLVMEETFFKHCSIHLMFFVGEY